MKIAVIGGKLQGTEAVYLAEKAGLYSILFDINENAPAAGLCDEFVCGDICRPTAHMIARLCDADFVLPATENTIMLEQICRLAKALKLRLAFDPEAYAITSSKQVSDLLFRESGIPCPKYYPEALPPYIAKPSGGSGSSGVQRVESRAAAEEIICSNEEYIVQEFLEGPSYSIEVIGVPGNYRVYEITEIHMDSVYDCRRVTAPCSVTEEQKAQMEEIGVILAEQVRLHGIMDVETILSRGKMKVLEIDARLPSQTPTVVLHSRGVNLLKELADITVYGTFCDDEPGTAESANSHTAGAADDVVAVKKERYCSYEHFEIKDGIVKGRGEHLMSYPGRLTRHEDCMGSDEVIFDLPGTNVGWRGTFINTADTEEELEGKRRAMMKELDVLSRTGTTGKSEAHQNRAEANGVASAVDCRSYNGPICCEDCCLQLGKPTAVYLLTGFLGAGKTSFLRHLLDTGGLGKTAVIINEFGAVNVDARLIKRDGIEMQELSNGSVFCACIKDKFTDSLLEMSGRKLDALVIEASGLADPSSMEMILQELAPHMATPMELAGRICVADSATFLDLAEVLPVLERQIEYADAVIVNKADLVGEEQKRRIREKLQEINPGVLMQEASFCKVDWDALRVAMGHGAKAPEESINTYESRPDAFTLSAEGAVSRKGLELFLNDIAEDAYRIKGFVRTEEGPLEVSAVGRRIRLTPWNEDTDTELVVISAVGIRMMSRIIGASRDRLEGRLKCNG